jgi:hypothetical protein
MSSDLKDIFDLARLRRAWGDKSGPPPSGPPSDSEVVAASPSEPVSQPVRRPQIVLDLLGEALRSEFPTHVSALSYHLDILRERLRTLLGEPAAAPGGESSPAVTGEVPAELATACHADVQDHLDQLEDLIDALSLPAQRGE